MPFLFTLHAVKEVVSSSVGVVGVVRRLANLVAPAVVLLGEEGNKR